MLSPTHRPPVCHASRPGHLPPTSIFIIILYLMISAPTVPTMNPDVLLFLSVAYVANPFCLHLFLHLLKQLRQKMDIIW